MRQQTTMSKNPGFCKFGGFIIFLVCLLVVNTGCLSDEEHYPFQGETQEFVHQNGLVVELPKTLVAKKTDQGFLIEPANDLNRHLRNSLIISIEKQNIEGTFALANTRQRKIRNRIIDYQIERSDGGSGGDEYHFKAWEKVDRDFIVYEQTQQSEYGEPNFTACWQIIEKTAVKN